MGRTEAWWVCRCGVEVAPAGKRAAVKAAMAEHMKTCTMPPGFAIQQLPQQRRRTK